jgi:hypothetical protein
MSIKVQEWQILVTVGSDMSAPDVGEPAIADS